MSEGVFLVNLDSTYVLGVLFVWGLYGALSAQVYLYYLAFPDDRALNKALVYGVYAIETIQLILLSWNGLYMYIHCSDVFVSPARFISSTSSVTEHLTWAAMPLLGALVAFAVQSFYAYRIHILGRSMVIMIFVILLAFGESVTSIIAGLWVFGSTAQLVYDNRTPPAFTVAWAVISIVCDITIASAMTYLLLRNDNGWKSTHTLLVKLVRLAVETGTVSVAASVAYLLCIEVLPVYTPALILTAVYSNAMMVNFNHRIRIYDGRDDTQITSFAIPPPQISSLQNPTI